MKNKFTITFLMILLLLPITVTAYVCESTCPTINPGCTVNFCNQTYPSESISSPGNIDYLEYNIMSPYMDFEMVVDSDAVGEYSPWITSYQSPACPSECDNGGQGAILSCSQQISDGTYILGVEMEGFFGSYSLTLTCLDLCSDCPPNDNCDISCGETISELNITKPNNRQYVYLTIPDNKRVTITVTPSDLFTEYDILATSSPNTCPTVKCPGGDGGPGDTNVCELDLSTGTYILAVEKESTTGTYDLNLECEELPYYDLDAWSRGPDLFTVGRSEVVNLYVKNLGNMIDNYTISVAENEIQAQKDGNSVPHLVDVSMHSNRISLVQPNKTGVSIATITLKGSVDSGSVPFDITSDSALSNRVYINLKALNPVNLPEFEFLGLMQILFLSILLIIVLRPKD